MPGSPPIFKNTSFVFVLYRLDRAQEAPYAARHASAMGCNPHDFCRGQNRPNLSPERLRSRKSAAVETAPPGGVNTP